jgi:hypothetical protein
MIIDQTDREQLLRVPVVHDSVPDDVGATLDMAPILLASWPSWAIPIDDPQTG